MVTLERSSAIIITIAIAGTFGDSSSRVPSAPRQAGIWNAHNLLWSPQLIGSGAAVQSARGHSLVILITVHWCPGKGVAVRSASAGIQTVSRGRVTVSGIAAGQSAAANVIQVAVDLSGTIRALHIGNAHNLRWSPLLIRRDGVIQSARGHSLVVLVAVHRRPGKRDAVRSAIASIPALFRRRVTVSGIASRQSTASDVIEIVASFGGTRWTR